MSQLYGLPPRSTAMCELGNAAAECVAAVVCGAVLRTELVGAERLALIAALPRGVHDRVLLVGGLRLRCRGDALAVGVLVVLARAILQGEGGRVGGALRLAV